MLDEARREVHDPERTAWRLERGLQDVGVLDVALGPEHAVRGPRDEAASRLVVQQGREDRLRVEARQAAPHHIPAPPYQGGELAVADQAEVLEAHGSNIAAISCFSN